MDNCKKSIYKIQNVFISTVMLVLIMFTSSCSYSQRISTNQYGLFVIKNTQEHKATVLADSSMFMINLQQFIPGLQIDIKYSTNNNFMHTILYPSFLNTTYLRAPAAMALKKVQEELAPMGLGLKVWDAYRPYSVTEKMWEQVKDDRYAADPKYGSGHNRGIAVDVTLVEIASGTEKNMGTGFDNFSDTAHSGYLLLPDSVLKNRQLLIGLMQKNGFKVLDTEWWHFYLPDNKKFPLMDLSFNELEKLEVKRKKKNK